MRSDQIPIRPQNPLTGGLLRVLTRLPHSPTKSPPEVCCAFWPDSHSPYKILARGLLCVLGQSFIVALSPVPGKVLTGGLLCPLVQRIVVALPNPRRNPLRRPAVP